MAQLEPPTLVPGQAVVRFSQKAYSTWSQSADIEGHRVLGRIPSLGAVLLNTGLTPLHKFQSWPGVRSVSPNWVIHPTFSPNDSMLSQQWNLTKVRALTAWDLGRGSSNTPIAIVDSGIQYTHPDLAAAYLAGGHDFANGDNDPLDDFGHGTLVAGIASAATNNSIGVAGMGFGCPVIAIKVLNGGGGGTMFGLAQGISYAVTNTNARVINVSSGANVFDQTVEDACAQAADAGVVIVAAAGNDNSTNHFFPAASQHCVSVGASTQTDARWVNSNYGTWVDVAAPGESILSTNLNSTYGSISGTSMASPLVAGLAGVLYNQLGAGRSKMKANIVQGAIRAGAADNAGWTGFGRIDALDSLRYVKGVSPVSMNWTSASPNGAPLMPMCTDSSGNVFFASLVGNASAQNINLEKHDPNGLLLWRRTLDGLGFADTVSRIAVDASGALYVAGISTRADNSTDALVAKYDSLGSFKWKRTFNGTANNTDAAYGLAIGSTNTAIVGTTTSEGKPTTAGIWVIKNVDGASVASKNFNLTTSFGDYGVAAVARSDGKFIVAVNSLTPTQDYNVATVLFNPTNSSVVTLGVYNGVGSTGDYASNLRLNKIGDAIVSGVHSDGTSFVLRVRSSGGFVWAKRFEGELSDLVLDGADDIYWTGITKRPVGRKSYWTVKMRSTDGTALWTKRVGGFGHSNKDEYDCQGVSLSMNGGSVLVTGSVLGINEYKVDQTDALTLWINASSGQLLRTARYDAGLAFDHGVSVVASPTTHNVFVGCSTAQASGSQVRLLKYAP